MKSSKLERFRPLTKEEDVERKKNFLFGISHRLEQGFMGAKAIVTWGYNGPQPAKLTVEVETLERADLLAKPFEDRLKVPDELPAKKDLPTWQPVPEVIANIHQLPNGIWQGTVPDLKPGFHSVRIGVHPESSKTINYSGITIPVPPIPAFWMNKWLLGSLFFACAAYLFRSPIMRVLGATR